MNRIGDFLGDNVMYDGYSIINKSGSMVLSLFKLCDKPRNLLNTKNAANMLQGVCYFTVSFFACSKSRTTVKIVRLKVYMTIASLITLTIIQGHKRVSNFTTF